MIHFAGIWVDLERRVAKSKSIRNQRGSPPRRRMQMLFEILFGYLACGTEVRAILLSFAVMSIFPQGQQKNKKTKQPRCYFAKWSNQHF